MMPSHPEPYDERGVREAYDTVAEDYAARLPDTRAEAAVDLAMVDTFVAAVTAVHNATAVLDAGCGTGRMGRYLADRGCHVEGVDLSPGMVAMARRARPDLRFTVASLTGLPFRDARFAGVLLWYSTIHTPRTGQPRIFTEARRVLAPGGHVLIGLQSGAGTRDVSAQYSRFGHDVRLQRHLFTADDVAGWMADAGLRELCRLVRRPQGGERDDQAFLLAQRS